MTNQDILHELASIDEMIGYRDQAQQAGDPESLCAARIIQEYIELGRARLKAATPAKRLLLIETLHTAEAIT